MLSKLVTANKISTFRAAVRLFSTNNNNNNKDGGNMPHQNTEPYRPDEHEWQRPIKGIDFDPESEDYQVPGVFREFRHQYSAKPTDRDAYLRQITYRCGHLGTKELEIIFRDWLTLYGKD